MNRPLFWYCIFSADLEPVNCAAVERWKYSFLFIEQEDESIVANWEVCFIFG